MSNFTDVPHLGSKHNLMQGSFVLNFDFFDPNKTIKFELACRWWTAACGHMGLRYDWFHRDANMESINLYIRS